MRAGAASERPGEPMDDIRWMTRALALAARGQGLTSPNPMVGALVVRDGAVIAERFHERAGGPHAEAAALEEAGASPSSRAITWAGPRPASRPSYARACAGSSRPRPIRTRA